MAETLKAPVVQDEQVLYARILETGVYIGLTMLLVTFALYVFGVLEPAVPLRDLPTYWSMNVHDYLSTVNAEHLHRAGPVTGWGWVFVLDKGDYLNFTGIALLSGVTVACYLGIVPMLLRKRDFAYAAIAVLESAILALAASGVLNVGH
jgi:hypothetical protein